MGLWVPKHINIQRWKKDQIMYLNRCSSQPKVIFPALILLIVQYFPCSREQCFAILFYRILDPYSPKILRVKGRPPTITEKYLPEKQQSSSSFMLQGCKLIFYIHALGHIFYQASQFCSEMLFMLKYPSFYDLQLRFF